MKDGRIVLPDGMSYRVLVLPRVETMTPALVRKIKGLVDAGATVFAAAAVPQKAPGLTDWPQCDKEVKQLATDLWTSGRLHLCTNVEPPSDTAEIYPHAAAVTEWFARNGVPPDFSATPRLQYIHRAIGGTDVHFVANPESCGVAATAKFHVDGRVPEFWWPDDGEISPAVAFAEKDRSTTVPLVLEPYGSVFVVFRQSSADVDPIVGVTRNGQQLLGETVPATIEVQPIDIARGLVHESGEYAFQTAGGKTRRLAGELPAPQEITGPWEVSFDPKWGSPEKVTFVTLDDWSKRPEEEIKYSSGTATYRATFQSAIHNPQSKFVLDLGRVEVMAEVALNGKPFGILWKRPYRVDVTDAIKPGENMLEIKVVNLWVNRQIRDEQLPEDSDCNPDGTLRSWPAWLNEGNPSPTGRLTFTSWRLWKKNDPLSPSGLLGP